MDATEFVKAKARAVTRIRSLERSPIKLALSKMSKRKTKGNGKLVLEQTASQHRTKKYDNVKQITGNRAVINFVKHPWRKEDPTKESCWCAHEIQERTCSNDCQYRSDVLSSAYLTVTPSYF